MLMRGTGIESVAACQTARTLFINLLSPNLCGDLDTVRGLPSGGCGDLTAEREFPSDKVYRREPRRVIGVEPFCLYGLGFFSVHSIVRCGLRRSGARQWLRIRAGPSSTEPGGVNAGP
jgi:hypothetical protein